MTAATNLRDRYDAYALSFIDQGMTPVPFERWLSQVFADRELWERYQ